MKSDLLAFCKRLLISTQILYIHTMTRSPNACRNPQPFRDVRAERSARSSFPASSPGCELSRAPLSPPGPWSPLRFLFFVFHPRPQGLTPGSAHLTRDQKRSPLLPHHDSLPPHPAPLSRSSHALRLLPPLPPYRRLRSLPRNCESACRMPMAHAVLTVFHALWQVIAKPFLRARAQAAHPPAQLGAGCSSVPVSWSVQRIGHARLRRDCYAPTGRRVRAPRPPGGGFRANGPVFGPQCMFYRLDYVV